MEQLLCNILYRLLGTLISPTTVWTIVFWLCVPRLGGSFSFRAPKLFSTAPINDICTVLCSSRLHSLGCYQKFSKFKCCQTTSTWKNIPLSVQFNEWYPSSLHCQKKRKIMSLPRALINITLLQVISHSVTYFRSTTELISYILKFKWPAGDHVQQMLYESNWRLQELYNPISQLPIKYFSVATRGKT